MLALERSEAIDSVDIDAARVGTIVPRKTGVRVKGWTEGGRERRRCSSVVERGVPIVVRRPPPREELQWSHHAGRARVSICLKVVSSR